MLRSIFTMLALLAITTFSFAQKTKPYKVIGYFSGDSAMLHKYDVKKLTHLIYGFSHVDNGNMVITKPKDAPALLAFQKIKKQHPGLKTMIALGGWGGCEFCSQTFNDQELTKKFALSVKDFLNKYELDGIDLDWEYPAIAGHPGHQYIPEDKDNFTNLVKELRKTLGKEKLITFAAGGFQKFLDASIAWHEVEPYLDFVNLMTYDLVHGYSTTTGHHTNLYATRAGEESADNTIKFFKKIKFPLKKLMLGAGFYMREFENVPAKNNGLYQPAKFLDFVDYRVGVNKYTKTNGYTQYWDNVAKAAYWYNPAKKIFVTGETKASVREKCAYIKKHKLGGFMFWELPTDLPKGGLYEAVKLN
ncbi:glycoside hydrolase family 18 protein [Haoranjiania flava]|uniref:chitinase n=1 Tax=Haoranjiania flava TaxID=1856322 RepID=A0AAE3LLH7_9BACT|nr:glycoside hydrolase family 18 protein [Haoranjiania flava]MCU7695414.1 glycoside hydrolase family 18 protein [Haoranjiania flava]